MLEDEEMREGRGKEGMGGEGVHGLQDAAGFCLEHTSIFDIHFCDPYRER